MWNFLSEILKAFFEKYLIPTIIAIAVAILSVIILPSDHFFFQRVGRFAFGALVACLTFLAVLLILQFTQGVKNILKKANDKKAKKKKEQTKRDIEAKNLWYITDKFSPDERDAIRNLIASGNKPIEKSSIPYFTGSLFFSPLVHSADVNTQFGPVCAYKLTDEAYDLLSYSINKYGKISHFD